MILLTLRTANRQTRPRANFTTNTRKKKTRGKIWIPFPTSFLNFVYSNRNYLPLI